MKISLNLAYNNINTQKTAVKKQPNTNPVQAQVDIQKNSMAELLGRTQTVSFGALNKMQGPIFEHTCKEKFGLGAKDVIKYNKENGSLKHEVFGSDGLLIESQEFFPQEGSEIHTKYDEYGNKTISTTTPDYKQVEKFDSKDRQILLDYQDNNGRKYRADIDYKRQRKVIRETNAALLPEQITVIDLTTQMPVTSGKLVIDTRYDKNSNTNITENILTKQILKIEHLRHNGTPERIVEYNETTGHIKKETNIDAKTGEKTERTYTGTGSNPLVSIIKTSRDGLKKHVIKYDDDGRTVSSNVLYATLKNGDPDYKVVYRGNSNTISYEEQYGDEDYSRIFYAVNPNIPIKEEIHSYDGDELLAEIKFYDDGKTKKLEKEFNEDGSWTETSFSTRGKKKETVTYANNGSPISIEKFDQKTGRLVNAVDFDLQTGYSEETFYDIYTQAITKSIIRDRQGNVTEETEYYTDGQTPKHNVRYNFDGSYTESFYWEDGGLRSQEEYDRYGRKKAPNYGRQQYQYQYSNQGQNQYNYQQQTNSTASAGSQRQKAESDSEFISRIGNIAANKDNNVLIDFKTSDWERLAKILGIENYETVKSMDPKLYRKLAMIYHPDKAPKDEASQKQYSQIFQIINEIHKKNNK